MCVFPVPDFLSRASVEELHKKMLAILPENMDKSQGQHVYNLTRPTALIAAELCQQTIPNIIRLIFPMWAYGEWLDYHAQLRGIYRRSATAASGSIIVTGKPPFSIAEGTEFTTAAHNNQPAIFYRAIETVNVPKSESKSELISIEVPVECARKGVIGNTVEHTILFPVVRQENIKSVDNISPITGGTEIESDESLRERILEYDASKSISYVGSVADYKRWSKEVDGVGEATVIPAQDDSGIVTIIITDSNGEPANKSLCDAVYNHIMSPDNPELRLTSPNARLIVIPPECILLTISAAIEPDSEFNLNQMKRDFITALQKYLAVCRADGEIRITQIGKILAGVSGVYDYKDLLLNGETKNISVSLVQLPKISEEDISFTLGTIDS